MKSDIEQLRILFTEKDICLPLRHCGADDISVNREIDSIVKNRDFFESLYSDYPLTGVYDRDTFWYYFLTEKISGMSGLCNYLDRNAAELLRRCLGRPEMLFQKRRLTRFSTSKRMQRRYFQIRSRIPNSDMQQQTS